MTRLIHRTLGVIALLTLLGGCAVIDHSPPRVPTSRPPG
jgi:hypothetical protein